MRHLYLAMSKQEEELHRRLRSYLRDGYKVGEAAPLLGMSTQRANHLLSKGKVTRDDLKQRRKDYIVHCSKTKYHFRHTPHVIACYFSVEESYVLQLIEELRAEGRLPLAPKGGREWQSKIISILQRHYRNVYPSWVIEKERELGDVLYVDGKGWLAWGTAEELARKHEPGKVPD